MENVSPCEERVTRGGCAILECFQKIPCDPCVDACPHGAITIEGNINDMPVLDFDKCNGCGLCVSKCPGLAIFVSVLAFNLVGDGLRDILDPKIRD